MGVYKEIPKADGSGITTFYRLSTENATVETTSTGSTETMFDYNNVLNKPSINDVVLIGNKTSADLGLQPAGNYITEIPEEYIIESELEAKDYATKTYVLEQLNNTEHFHREIVDALPLTGKDNVLYLVAKKGTDKDIYNEYIWTGTDYELLGTTATDLSDYYKKPEVDDLIDTRVKKETGKGLSTNDYTTAEKTKLASLENYDDSEIKSQLNQLHNYDDTEVKKDIAALKTADTGINNEITALKKKVIKKIEYVRLVKSGDSWTWMNVLGDNLAFDTAKTLLGLEDTFLIIEDIENDGKMIPTRYDIDEDKISIWYVDISGETYNIVLSNQPENKKSLGFFNHILPHADTLPTIAQKGDIISIGDSNKWYIYDDSAWHSFAEGTEPDLSNYLAKNNTVAYKPAADYNPSTKKYVDDSIKDLFIPTKTSQLTNDSNFVIKTTNELTNYYTKNNTYTKNEVNALVAGGGGGSSVSITVNGDTLVITTK